MNDNNLIKTIECRQCGKTFEWIKENFYCRTPDTCPECLEVESQHNLKQEQDKLEKSIFQLTPRRYNDTDVKHPDFNVRLWEKVQTWIPTDQRPWLGIVGPTGRCKSRVAYLRLATLAGEMIWKSGETYWSCPTIKVITAYDFADAVKNQFSDDKRDKAEAKELLAFIKRVDLLLFDDLGKSRNTPAASGELFALIDRRHEENRRTIWTSNLSPEGIVAGMPEETGIPLAGRIRECSTILNIK